MPELPDVVVYQERLEAMLAGEPLERFQLDSPFVLRTVVPSPQELVGRRLVAVHRIGKRLALEFDGNYFLVIHLMIAGRLKWRAPGKTLKGRGTLAALGFPRGTLYLTEAGTTRRASLHLVAGQAALAQFSRGGLEVLEADLVAFAARLRSENHTIKRSLTDPRLFSGIGNAYSDEILHRSRLSPLQLTSRMDDDTIARLFEAAKETLLEWTARLRTEVGEGFPEKVTAFHDEMAVHGRFRQPCPTCGTPVQRIRYAENETNYCPRCQTGGRLLADRAMSRLLKGDWPRSIDELDA